MKESFVLESTFNAEPSALYQAWLSSELHGKMTGGEAEASTVVGEAFSAWDGYIWGTNIELIENAKIVQSWRTTEFKDPDEDSRLILEFFKTEEGTLLRLTHENIPAGQTQYEQGWINHYFHPMRAFFGSS